MTCKDHESSNLFDPFVEGFFKERRVANTGRNSCCNSCMNCWVTLTPLSRLEAHPVKVARTVIRRATSRNRWHLCDKNEF